MKRSILLVLTTLSLTACSTIPSGPSALVLPGQHKDQQQFRQDDESCRKLAHSQLLLAPHQPQSLGEGQLHFDIYYLQCMYGKGHLIPVSGEVIPDVPEKSGNPAPK